VLNLKYSPLYFIYDDDDDVVHYHRSSALLSHVSVIEYIFPVLSQGGMKPISEEDKSVPEFVKMQRRITSKTPTSPPT
jgi:hypothetical protein